MAKKWTETKKDESFQAVLRVIEQGYSLRKVCRGDFSKELWPDDKVEIPSMTVFLSWLSDRDNGAFSLSQQYARACEIRADVIFEECLEIADEADRDISLDDDGNQIVNREVVQRSKLRIDTRKWMAGKMRPKKYGDRIALTGGDEDDAPIKIDITRSL